MLGPLRQVKPQLGRAPAVSNDQPHDALIKALFRDPQHIVAELKRLLPASIIERLDLSTVRLAEGVSIDPKLRDRSTDLWFEVRLRSGQQGYVFMLYEHQSSVQHEMAWRLVDYITRFWRDWIDACEGRGAPAFPLPAVVPVVLYNGARRWTAPRRFVELIDLDEEGRAALKPYLLDVEYRLESLSELSRAELHAQVADLPEMMAVAFLLMRAVTQNRNLVSILEGMRAELMRFLRAAHPDEIQLILSYIERS